MKYRPDKGMFSWQLRGYVVLIVIATTAIMSADFDLSTLDFDNIYTYRAEGDDGVFIIRREFSTSDDNIVLHTQRTAVGGETDNYKMVFRKDGSPVSTEVFDKAGNVVCSAIYDYDADKVYLTKDGHKKTVKLKKNPLDGLSVEVAVGGLIPSECRCTGYSCLRQGSAGMTLTRLGRESVTVPAGTFETVKTEHKINGLLSMVVPTMTYWHDLKTGQCVRFTAGDVVRVLESIEPKK